MKNIIVPTDFSLKSLNALEVAKRIARRTRGQIHLLHVIEPVTAMYRSTGELDYDDLDDFYMVQLIEMVEEKLSMLKLEHEKDRFQIIGKVSIGNPFQEIRNYAKSKEADVLILGAKGSTNTNDFFLGALTDKVIRSSNHPVITVNEVLQGDEFRNIVYATDLKADHKPMINLLMRLQDLFDSNIHIVKINTRKDFNNDIDTMVKLQRIADQYMLNNYTLTSYSHEDEEYGILHFSDQKKADLIAIGIHEKSGFRRVISGGSIVEDLSGHSFRPILTLGYNVR
ncbi:MAG: universal stress protein [bacterium]|nr:universal stress protein [bacterium]